MSKKTRCELLAWFLENEELTTKQAYELCAGNYFYNGKKHVNDNLARLVKSGDIVRVKRGLYMRGRGGGKYTPPPDNQLKLFEE